MRLEVRKTKGCVSMSKVITRDAAIDVAKQFASRVYDEIDKDAKIYLFGSTARNEANERSDIDIAVVSGVFGTDVVANRVSISLIGYSVHPDIETHAIRAEDWGDVTPFIYAVRAEGILV